MSGEGGNRGGYQDRGRGRFDRRDKDRESPVKNRGRSNRSRSGSSTSR